MVTRLSVPGRHSSENIWVMEAVPPSVLLQPLELMVEIKKSKRFLQLQGQLVYIYITINLYVYIHIYSYILYRCIVESDIAEAPSMYAY